MQKFFIVAIGIIIGAVAGMAAITMFNLKVPFFALNTPPSQGQAPIVDDHQDFHQHVDLRVVIRGKQLDLSVDEYQSNQYEYHDQHIHLHDNNGKVVHLHKAGVTLAEFLQTIAAELTDTCITINPDFASIEAYCELPGESEVLKVVVNGVEVPAKSEYQFQDLDQVLVYFGQPDQVLVDAQVEQVSDDACIYSLTCPERGTPPLENCIADPNHPCEVGEGSK